MSSKMDRRVRGLKLMAETDPLTELRGLDCDDVAPLRNVPGVQPITWPRHRHDHEPQPCPPGARHAPLHGRRAVDAPEPAAARGAVPARPAASPHRLVPPGVADRRVRHRRVRLRQRALRRHPRHPGHLAQERPHEPSARHPRHMGRRPYRHHRRRLGGAQVHRPLGATPHMGIRNKTNLARPNGETAYVIFTIDADDVVDVIMICFDPAVAIETANRYRATITSGPYIPTAKVR